MCYAVYADFPPSAHFAMMKDVPIVGWDVAFTDKGVYLLEVPSQINYP